MKDSRAGEALWKTWDGEGYREEDNGVVFFTEEHVDLENDIVRRALASALQREGVVSSLGQAYRLLESAICSELCAGPVDGDTVYSTCSADGETYYGEKVDFVKNVTLVEVLISDL